MSEVVSVITREEPSTIEVQLSKAGDDLVEKANALRIESQPDYVSASALLVEIKTRYKKVVEYWKKPKADALASHRTICDREKAMLTPLNTAESIIKKNMVAYQAAVEKAQLEAEEAARRIRQEEADRLLEQAALAEDAGDDNDSAIKLAMAEMITEMKTEPIIDTPKAAGTSVRKTWKARVIDAKAVPAYANGMEIRDINMSALNQIAKLTSGTASIPGVEFYQESSISARSH